MGYVQGWPRFPWYQSDSEEQSIVSHQYRGVGHLMFSP